MSHRTVDAVRSLTPLKPRTRPRAGFFLTLETQTMPNTRKTRHQSRSARPDPAPGSFAADIRALADRLGLNESRAADYLGVPVFTFRKWATGERQPGAAVLRLLDVLGMVEAMTPALHTSLLPPESRHVEKSGAKRSTGSTQDSVMPKNPV